MSYVSSFGFWFLREQIRSSDTSTGESGSEVEDITSPKASGNCTNPILTPVREEVSDHDIDLEATEIQKMLQQINIPFYDVYPGKIGW